MLFLVWFPTTATDITAYFYTESSLKYVEWKEIVIGKIFILRSTEVTQF